MKRVFVLLCALAVVTACRTSPPPANGWAIVAADPATGDVGVAGASCGNFAFDYRAMLLPKHGALVQLGVNSPLQRDRLGAWLESPEDAPSAAQRITALSNDTEAATRQYGIVTIHQRTPQVAGFTGAENAAWAGNLEDESVPAVAVGSGLAQAQTPLKVALAVFHATGDSAMTLSDKLLRALEAGSAAGGVAQCNANGVQQTASTAFVMMAQGGDPNFRVQTLGNSAALEPNPPFLALSTTEPRGGKNAVYLLRQQYNGWRATHLNACETCTQSLAPVPEGGTLTAAPDSASGPSALWLVTSFVIWIMTATILFFAFVPRSLRTCR